MAAALTATVEQNGVPLGSFVLSGALQEAKFTMKNRLNGLVQAIAIVNGLAVAFQYATTSAGTPQPAPAGSGIILPLYKVQSWFFQQDPSSAGATIYFQCVG